MADRDRLERSLREPGPRERGYRHEPLPISLSEARRQRGATRPLLRAVLIGAVAASAAAVTLAVTLGLPNRPVGSSAGNSSTASSSAQSSPAPSSSVASSVSPSSNPAAACLASNLAISADPWGGAAGSRGTTVLFRTLDSAGRCTLQGSPQAELVDATGKVLVSSVASSSGSRVQLGAGRVAELIISWSNLCPQTSLLTLKLVLHLDGATAELQATSLDGGQMIDPPPCSGSGEPSTLNVVPFQASTRPFPPG